MTQNESPEAPSHEEAVALLSTLPDGQYTPSDLFDMSPEHGLAGLALARTKLEPPTRRTRFRGTSGETQLSRPPRPDQYVVSRSAPWIHVEAGKVWITFEDERARPPGNQADG